MPQGNLRKKLEFICNNKGKKFDYYLLIAVGAAVLGLACCLISSALIIRLKIE
jgi:hypothetical protein